MSKRYFAVNGKCIRWSCSHPLFAEETGALEGGRQVHPEQPDDAEGSGERSRDVTLHAPLDLVSIVWSGIQIMMRKRQPRTSSSKAIYNAKQITTSYINVSLKQHFFDFPRIEWRGTSGFTRRQRSVIRQVARASEASELMGTSSEGGGDEVSFCFF